MTVACHMLFFNTDQFIVKSINNCGEYVDSIYIGYSEYSWNYKNGSRNKFKNNANLDILKESKFYNKIKVIEGKWDKDEDERNACLDAAKKDKHELMIIKDADEFYFEHDFTYLVNEMKNPNNKDIELFKTPWISFWKNFKNIVVNKRYDSVIGFPEIGFRISDDVKFVNCRIVNKNKFKILNKICYHGSFVLTNEQCYGKINTWGHSNQFDTEKWFNEKWLGWDLDNNIENLHPLSPEDWKKTQEYKYEIPEVIKDFTL